MTEDLSVPRVQGRVVGYIHWPGGRKEEIREETVTYLCTPAERAELFEVLKRQEEERIVRRLVESAEGEPI
jgi:hypothetical protein